MADERNSGMIKPLNAKLNPTCHSLALLGAHPILHVSRLRINKEYLRSAESSLLTARCNVTFAPFVEDQELLNTITDRL